MKSLVCAAAAGMLFAGTAQHAMALSVTFDSLSPTDSYYAPLGGTASGTGTYVEDTTGSVSGVRTSPFGDTTTHYDSVGADSAVTFGSGPEEPEAKLLAVGLGGSSSSFVTGGDTFKFVWGSPDDYNKLTFYNGGSEIGSFQLSASSAPTYGVTLGSGAYLATVSGLGAYDGVRLESDGANAFEFAAVSAVPLPAGLPMFAGAILLLGLVGFKARSKSATQV